MKAQAQDTLPALAEKMESLRENMTVFRYQVLHTLSDKRHTERILKILQPKFTRYVSISGQIKEKIKERKTLLAEKKSTPILQILKHRKIVSRIAELIEELEELRSEKIQLLQSLGYGEDTGVDEIREDVSTMGALHKQLVQQEQKYRAEYDIVLKEYTELNEQATEFDTDELMRERLAIRPSKEHSAVSRMQYAYGNKYRPLMMYDSKQSESDVLSEKAEMQSVREGQHQRVREENLPLQNRKVKEQERHRIKGNGRER